MKVGFLTQWFPPEQGTLVASAIADGLAERGHDVDVVTGFPNYPTGKLYAGYPLRHYRRDQRSARVTVHRAPLYPSHNAKAVQRMANYASFGLSAAWMVRARLTRPDVWLVYSSPATAALPAMLAPTRLRAPTYLIVQDLWPDSVTESGFLAGNVGRSVERSLDAYCQWCYRRASGIGIISPGMRRILQERGVNANKIHLTPNWANDDHLHPRVAASEQLRRTLGLPAGRLFMYAGNLGELQGLEPLVSAFRRCPDAHFALVGDGVAKPALEALVSSQGIRNVSFISAQRSEEIGHFIAASDVQIVSLKDSLLLRATMPSKLQTSMAAGRPILAHAAGDVAQVVTESGAGLAVTPGDVDAATSTIRRFEQLSSEVLRDMGYCARSYYLDHFTPDAGLDRLESMLGSGGAIGPRRTGIAHDLDGETAAPDGRGIIS